MQKHDNILFCAEYTVIQVSYFPPDIFLFVLLFFSPEETESDTSLNRSGSSLGQQMYSRSGRRRTLSTTDDILEIHEVVARLSAKNKAEDGNDEVEEEEEEEEDEESDWDSWSEEGEPDQEHSALQTHFQDFFQHLRDIYGAGKTVVTRCWSGTKWVKSLCVCVCKCVSGVCVRERERECVCELFWVYFLSFILKQRPCKLPLQCDTFLLSVSFQTSWGMGKLDSKAQL